MEQNGVPFNVKNNVSISNSAHPTTQSFHPNSEPPSLPKNNLLSQPPPQLPPYPPSQNLLSEQSVQTAQPRSPEESLQTAEHHLSDISDSPPEQPEQTLKPTQLPLPSIPEEKNLIPTASSNDDIHYSPSNKDSTMLSLPGQDKLPLNKFIRPISPRKESDISMMSLPQLHHIPQRDNKRKLNSTENPDATAVNINYNKKHKSNITNDITVILLFYLYQHTLN